jgi:hypothetical protein
MNRTDEIRALAEAALAYIDERQNPEAWGLLGSILSVTEGRRPTEESIEQALNAACARLHMERYATSAA